MPESGSSRVAIVGATLTGLAAAARLSRLGHDVVLLESNRQPPPLLPTPLGEDGAAIALPAAWKDLFKKSGRPLDAELRRAGLALTLAPPRLLPTATGTLELPHGRAGQWYALSAAYGPAVATTWRDLLDRLDGAWQVLRPLGVEAELPVRLDRVTVRSLRSFASLADLATGLPSPLADLVLDLARRRDSDPAQTPGWLATRLAIERSFGLWHLTDPSGDAHPAQQLVELLWNRLTERGIELRLGVTAGPVNAQGRLETTADALRVDATVWTINPWQLRAVTHDRALRRTRQLTPADTAGPRWLGWRTLAQLPPLALAQPRQYAASGFSPAGPEPWAQLLSGALAAYRVHADLTGQDARPANKSFRLPRLG